MIIKLLKKTKLMNSHYIYVVVKLHHNKTGFIPYK